MLNERRDITIWFENVDGQSRQPNHGERDYLEKTLQHSTRMLEWLKLGNSEHVRPTVVARRERHERPRTHPRL